MDQSYLVQHSLVVLNVFRDAQVEKVLYKAQPGRVDGLTDGVQHFHLQAKRVRFIGQRRRDRPRSIDDLLRIKIRKS